MKKKLLAIILSAALVCAMLPFAMFSAFAAEVASGTCGTDVTWSLDSDGVLTISGSGAMADYDTIEDEHGWEHTTAPWFEHAVGEFGVNVVEVVIENGVTSVGDAAFAGMESITAVSFADSVTSIGECAFQECRITNLTIGNGVTSIGPGAFNSCSRITSITLPDGLESIGPMAFGVCARLENLTIPASVESIGDLAFLACGELETITILNPNVTIGNGFAGMFESVEELEEAADGATFKGAFTLAGTSSFVIRGYSGSTAEAYANTYSIAFESLGGAPAVPTFQAIYGLLNDGMTNPAETFSFTIAKVGVTDSDNYNLNTMPMFDPATYTISFANGEATLAGDTNETELTLPTYEHVGIFTYTITQTAGTTAGVTYDDTVIYMVITATQGANGIETTVAMHYGLNGEKTSFLTNTYSAGTLAITGDTTGNLSDLNKEFTVTVTFTREAGKTGDLVIGYTEDGVDYVVSGENGVYTATIHIKDGETITFTNIPYGTTYTVVEADYTGEGYDAAVYSVADIDTLGGTMGAASNPLTITNNKDVLIDTGVLLNSMPYAIALSGMIGAAVIVLLAKKKRKEVEED